MRIAILNMVPYGSTGKIMLQTAQVAREHGHKVKTFSTEPYSRKGKPERFTATDHRVWGSFGENRLHYYLGSTLGRNGCYSKRGTRRLVRELAAFGPDVVHLHNLHNFCIHLPTLFHYLKKQQVRVTWTLHDCWSFTGQCPHFDYFGCDKWKTGCHHCKQPISYPRSRVDNAKRMYGLKKRWFTNVPDMTLVTPSRWLGNLVKESFLKDYPVRVIHNGIDLDVFRPTPSDFAATHGCADKKLVLGVSFGWSHRKGLDVFGELARRLDNTYQVVLVGADKAVADRLPDNILCIPQTHDQQELAAIYSAADVFVNATREDTFPTVNIEALACGTPVVTFRTGGSPEIPDATCGAVVERDDVDALEREVRRVCTDKPYTPDACCRRAQTFDRNDRFAEYVTLYEEGATP